jgi:undecaprenyl-diphosphatase
MLHIGTSLAVITYFWADWIRMIKNLLFSKDKHEKLELTNLIIGTLPAVIIGLSIESIISRYLRNPWIVVFTLFAVAILIFWAEKFSKKNRGYSDFNIKHSFLIGVAQAIALIPGVSRSGITMTTSLFLGYDRVSAAKFSFLLSAPIILGAGVYEGLKLYKHGLHTLLSMYLVGFISSAISGYFAIAFLMKFLQTRNFFPFVYYRIILAIFVALALIFKN